MADRWMDERDRDWRERDWRRSEGYGRGGEDRTWAGPARAEAPDLRRRSPPDDGYARSYRADRDERRYGGPRAEGVSCRGLGPKNYQRSDARISDDVHDRLTEDPWLDASDIVVAVNGGEVTLSGRVDCRDAKHHAEWLVEDLSGVRHVQNNLRVDPGAGLAGAGRGFGSSTLEAEMRRNEQGERSDLKPRRD
jgi:hypothetical protein